MKTERSYQFREFLDQVHLAGRRDVAIKPKRTEVVVDSSWEIAIREDADRLIMSTAQDLQDYFFTSMDVSLAVRRCRDFNDSPTGNGRLILTARSSDPGFGGDADEPRGYALNCAKGMIVICGNTPRGAAQGAYYLEDLMNLREAPYLEVTPSPVSRKPLFSPRMTHSGWGMDQFPDTQLNAIAHAVFDAVLVFAKGVDLTTHGHMDFNNLIHRAGNFGLDVYFYSYLNSFKHPADPDADKFFEDNFGSLFRHCPGAKGLILVGESCEFSSKDPATTGKLRSEDKKENAGIADHRPSPGWWPCKDYPQWLDAIKKAVRKHQPSADIVFWTYNWGRAPEKPRVDLIKNLPLDATLLATFEMFEPIDFENYTALSPDYTITFPGPGRYFSSEAAAAKERGMRLYTMSNTGGMTWDMGVVPYIPTPQQWFKRFSALREAKAEWNLSGLMDSHHYGWWPSPVCECAKWSFWTPEVDIDEMLRKMASRDFGAEAAGMAIEGWRKWSEAIASFIPGFDDQSGPLRVGPAYPLVFHPCLYPPSSTK